MLQAWFARTHKRGRRRDPYFLYAASNLGSLLALLAYPLVIEANLTLRGRAAPGRSAYGLLMALIAACAARLWRDAGGTAPLTPGPSPGGRGEIKTVTPGPCSRKGRGESLRAAHP